MLEVKEFSRRFGGVRAVDCVSLAVRKGQVHGLIGPNGAGKTTMLNLISGALTASSGSIRLEGSDVTRTNLQERAALGIRRTFQNLKLFGPMSVCENVLIGLHTEMRSGVFDALVRSPRLRREESEMRDKAKESLLVVGLETASDISASVLPYGHRRLLEIARAIASSPKVLLLDEPAAGLNATESKRLLGVFERLCKRGMSLILVDHHIDLVMSACSSISVVNYGRKLAEGTPSEIRSNKLVIEAYLGREPTPNQKS